MPFIFSGTGRAVSKQVPPRASPESAFPSSPHALPGLQVSVSVGPHSAVLRAGSSPFPTRDSAPTFPARVGAGAPCLAAASPPGTWLLSSPSVASDEGHRREEGTASVVLGPGKRSRRQVSVRRVTRHTYTPAVRTHAHSVQNVGDCEARGPLCTPTPPCVHAPPSCTHIHTRHAHTHLPCAHTSPSRTPTPTVHTHAPIVHTPAVHTHSRQVHTHLPL